MSERRASRISTDIDYERDGKQSSWLKVPNSRDDSGWGTLLMPITVIKNGAGPTLLFTAANHGDEYEGPVALMKLARALEPAEVAGRVIILPALNLPALMAGKRLSPIDGKNMNRSFPGSADGTITSMVADYVYTELVARADAVADLHSGGYSMKFLPAVMMHYLDDAELERRTLAALKAFGAPVALMIEELDTEGMLDTAVEELGKVFLGTELGGGAVLSPETVGIAELGVRNLLKHFGIVEGEVVRPEAEGRAPGRLMETPDSRYFVSATSDGLYEPFVEVGEEVEAGAAVGQIHFVEDPGREPDLKTVERAGLLITRRAPGRVARGDLVAMVARDLEG
ncbi:MAG: succinylglutamate desuccinylase/aspartoacylase family protein [Alphaproteobacteria bacterium]